MGSGNLGFGLIGTLRGEEDYVEWPFAGWHSTFKLAASGSAASGSVARVHEST
jgi:hypothetical protein